jgi:hypothetical protein
MKTNIFKIAAMLLMFAGGSSCLAKEDTIMTTKWKFVRDASFDAGVGLGVSYGLLGIKMQGRILNNRIGGFIGMGHFPSIKPKILFAGGIKFFPYKNIYLSVQYGCVDAGKSRSIVQLDQPTPPHYYSPAYAFSVMAGNDFIIWKNWGINLAAGSAYLKERYNKAVFVMDAGVFWRF